MTSRWARAEDTAALCALWQLCFGDEAAVPAAFFAQLPPARHARVIFEGGQLRAMASWLPMLAGHWSGAYIYAVATHPAARGAGLCRCLMGELEQTLAQQGVAFAALSPAEPPLFAFYAAMGYRDGCYCSRRTVQPSGEAVAVEEVEAGEYLRLREKALSIPHCAWGEDAMAYLRATGTRLLRLPGGCAAVSREGETLWIPELLSAEVTAQALCRTLGAPSASVRTPGGETCEGMVKPLRGGLTLPPLDLGFTFE